MTELPDEFALVHYTMDGDVWTAFCAPYELPRIEDAVSAYLQAAGSRDWLLTISLIHGATCTLPVSSIRSWVQTSRDQHLAMLRFDAARERAAEAVAKEEKPGSSWE